MTSFPLARLTASRSWSADMLSKQHGVGLQREQFIELIKRVDFHLDLHHVAGIGARPLDRIAKAARSRRYGCP